jgi:hypothetical protein
MMTHSRKIKAMMRIVIVFTITLIALIIAYETTLILNSNRTTAYVSAQEWVSQRIAKDALLMQYGTADDRVEAVNEIQNMLPYFESNQAHITASPQADAVATLIHSASVDYVDIDTAAKNLLASSDTPADPVQVRIILDHERSFFLAYSQINMLVQQNNSAYLIFIFSIIIGAKIVLIGTNGVLLYLLEKKIIVSPQEASNHHKENS